MKATGIVRRIDELGRIVIPKEIRRTLRIRESDPMEIFTDREGGVVLKKYSPIGELGDTAQEYVESVANVAKCTACVADRDRIVAAAGSQSRQYMGKELDDSLKECIQDRGTALYADGKGKMCRIIQDMEPEPNQAVSTIVCEGDAIGAVILLSNDTNHKFGEFEEKMSLCGAGFLGKQMEQ
ncbi:MAG: stage V sporulation T C-terminal domain-containing protein [Eubacterium sp.]